MDIDDEDDDMEAQASHRATPSIGGNEELPPPPGLVLDPSIARNSEGPSGENSPSETWEREQQKGSLVTRFSHFLHNRMKHYHKLLLEDWQTAGDWKTLTSNEVISKVLSDKLKSDHAKLLVHNPEAKDYDFFARRRRLEIEEQESERNLFFRQILMPETFTKLIESEWAKLSKDEKEAVMDEHFEIGAQKEVFHPSSPFDMFRHKRDNHYKKLALLGKWETLTTNEVISEALTDKLKKEHEQLLVHNPEAKDFEFFTKQRKSELKEKENEQRKFFQHLLTEELIAKLAKNEWDRLSENEKNTFLEEYHKEVGSLNFYFSLSL